MSLTAGIASPEGRESSPRRETQSAEQSGPAVKRACRILAARAHGVHELRLKLRRGFPPAEVERTLAGLAELGYLDDLKFACDYARSRFSRSPRSPSLVETELVRRGVEAVTVKAAVQSVLSEGGLTEKSLAGEAARKKLASLKGLEPGRQKLKLLRFLSSRGFAESIVREAIQRLRKNAE